MNAEIENIIDYIASRTVDDILLEDYFNKLDDYITNLQQSDNDKQLEIMKLKDRLEKQRKEYQDTYKDVRIEVKEKNNLIKEYETFINELAMKMKIDPKILIKGKVSSIEITNLPYYMKQHLNVIWEYDLFDVDLTKQINNDIEIELLKK